MGFETVRWLWAMLAFSAVRRYPCGMAFPLHDYLMMTAEITTQCFFFVGGLNAAVAAWVSQLSNGKDAARTKEITKVIFWLNFGMAWVYVLGLPILYSFSYFQAEPVDRVFAFQATLVLWSLVAIAFGAILFAVNRYWWKE